MFHANLQGGIGWVGSKVYHSTVFSIGIIWAEIKTHKWHSMKSWLVGRDPYDGLWNNPALYIYIQRGSISSPMYPETTTFSLHCSFGLNLLKALPNRNHHSWLKRFGRETMGWVPCHIVGFASQSTLETWSSKIPSIIFFRREYFFEPSNINRTHIYIWI